MRPRQNAEHSSAVARRMAAVSAELAAMRERQLRDRTQPAPGEQESIPATSAPGRDLDVEPAPAASVGAPGEALRTVVRDDRWERWWPEASEQNEPYTVVAPRTSGPRHASHRGRSAPISGRGRLAPVHLTVLALLVAASLAVTAWWVARSSPSEVSAASEAMPLVTAAASPSPAMQSPAAPGASATPVTDSNASPQSAVVVVHVAGKVLRPGIQELPLGSRVADALRAAGGPRPGVSLTSLNLARRLEDGEQVVVGGPVAPAGASGGTSSAGPVAGAAPSALVNLNTADVAGLDTLPGVGPVTAAAIVEHRERNGAFTSVDQLIDVSGIGEATLAKLAPLVSV